MMFGNVSTTQKFVFLTIITSYICIIFNNINRNYKQNICISSCFNLYPIRYSETFQPIDRWDRSERKIIFFVSHHRKISM